MTHSEADDDAKRLANQRRQAYYRRRRTVQKTAAKGKLVAVDYMSHEALRMSIRGDLWILLSITEEGSSPRLYEAARRAWECWNALDERGDQLDLGFD